MHQLRSRLEEHGWHAAALPSLRRGLAHASAEIRLVSYSPKAWHKESLDNEADTGLNRFVNGVPVGLSGTNKSL